MFQWLKPRPVSPLGEHLGKWGPQGPGLVGREGGGWRGLVGARASVKGLGQVEPHPEGRFIRSTHSSHLRWAWGGRIAPEGTAGSASMQSSVLWQQLGEGPGTGPRVTRGLRAGVRVPLLALRVLGAGRTWLSIPGTSGGSDLLLL